MEFKQKKLEKIINSQNKQIRQYTQNLDNLSEKMSITMNEENFEYMKSVLIQYIETDYFILILDVIVKVLTYSTLSFLTVFISFMMTGIQSFDEVHLVRAFIILIILNTASYLMGNNISSYSSGLDTKALKLFTYKEYCYTKENILEKKSKPKIISEYKNLIKKIKKRSRSNLNLFFFFLLCGNQ
ncbi:hypothetical protein [Faecalicoccus pleomorphus]|uniref:hypothetical protein n=1 Tax=Faecalicoccus pleomorphus TaxID=1323 RepID=UPI0022E057E1|nr:hypothetical protein [Faecalicoccus pleomorphus]